MKAIFYLPVRKRRWKIFSSIIICEIKDCYKEVIINIQELKILAELPKYITAYSITEQTYDGDSIEILVKLMI